MVPYYIYLLESSFPLKTRKSIWHRYVRHYSSALQNIPLHELEKTQHKQHGFSSWVLEPEFLICLIGKVSGSLIILLSWSQEFRKPQWVKFPGWGICRWPCLSLQLMMPCFWEYLLNLRKEPLKSSTENILWVLVSLPAWNGNGRKKGTPEKKNITRAWP